MKALSILVIIGAFIMGIYDGDSTAAVILIVLLAPILLERKKVKKCTTRNVRNAVRH